MLIVAILIILVLLTELAAWIYETRQIAQTRVSTLSETNYATPPLGKWLALGGLLAAVVALSAGLFWPLRPVGGLAVLALFVVLRATLSSQVLAAARVSMRARLREAFAHPEIQKTRIAFYFSAPDLERPEHVITWAEEINALEISWFVILREPHHLKAFDEANHPTAIIVPDDTALASCLPPLVRIVFYANNGQKNRKMLTFHPDAFHIQLLHGDSDKPPSYSPLTQNYDLIFVAGQMGIDRYAQNGVHIPAEKFRIIGRPQVRAISNVPRDEDGGPHKVIYMPVDCH